MISVQYLWSKVKGENIANATNLGANDSCVKLYFASWWFFVFFGCFWWHFGQHKDPKVRLTRGQVKVGSGTNWFHKPVKNCLPKYCLSINYCINLYLYCIIVSKCFSIFNKTRPFEARYSTLKSALWDHLESRKNCIIIFRYAQSMFKIWINF